MPNHVFHRIRTYDECAIKIIKNVERKYSKGLCELVAPMPNNQWDYNWCVENWGTKWGAYDNHIQEFENAPLLYEFTTAWSPFNEHIVRKICKLLQNLEWEWQEEQGFGESFDVENGEVTRYNQWESIDWEHTEHDRIIYTQGGYSMYTGDVREGWYIDYDVCLSDQSYDKALEMYKRHYDES